jgi:hypothetical protein
MLRFLQFKALLLFVFLMWHQNAVSQTVGETVGEVRHQLNDQIGGESMECPLGQVEFTQFISICEGSEVSIWPGDAEGLEPITYSGNINWYDSLGVAMAKDAYIRVGPRTSTDYSFIGIIGPPLNCKIRVNISVQVRPAPKVDAGPDVMICPGESATLTATGTGSQFEWWNRRNFIASTPSITVTPTVTTTYMVVNTQGGCSDSDSVVVNVITDLNQGCNTYVLLKLKQDGGYYLTRNGYLYFVYEEEYKVASASNLIFNVYKRDRQVASGIPAQPVGEGDNRFRVNLQGAALIQDDYYVLEVVNNKSEKKYLRFQYKK